MNKDFAKVSAFIFVPLIAIFLFSSFTNVAEGTNTPITVSATVNQSVTCNTSTSSVVLGTLTSNAISSTSPSQSASSSLSCNTGLGCTLSVQDQGNGVSPGLSTSSPAYLIPSADGLVIAGTENYGIQASSTAEGSGGVLKVATKYGSTTYAGIGGLLRTATTIASSTAQISNKSILVTHWAAISGTTQAGLYADTITYSCTGN